MFDEAIGSALQSAGNHPRIGGTRGKESRVFLPTGETLHFLAGVQTIAERLQVMRLFEEDHRRRTFDPSVNRCTLTHTLTPNFPPLSP